MLLKIIFISLFIFTQTVFADVVKPALVEIQVNTNQQVTIELRASLEALLTGINSRYKNTQEAPNAEAYDDLRVLEAEQLSEKFRPFEAELLKNIRLIYDNHSAKLAIQSIDIPLPGYTKVPRISTVLITTNIPRHTKTIQWYYPEKFGDNAVRVKQVDEENQKWFWSPWQWLRNDQTSEVFSLTEVFTRQTLSSIFMDYVRAGFEHIIPKGLDHILFILGLFFLSTHLKPLIWQVTMFTLAHTITLGMGVYGLITIPSFIVEPLIALSIAYIGLENIRGTKLHNSRLLVVFSFGLLHGLGFATMLTEMGLPDYAFFWSLLSFNIGVELGQFFIILLAFITTAFWFRTKVWYRTFVVMPVSILISLTGLYWTFERLDTSAISGIVF